jgi:hypothetical protein
MSSIINKNLVNNLTIHNQPLESENPINTEMNMDIDPNLFNQFLEHQKA